MHAIAVVVNAGALRIKLMRFAIESKQQRALLHGDVFSRAAGMREKTPASTDWPSVVRMNGTRRLAGRATDASAQPDAAFATFAGCGAER